MDSGYFDVCLACGEPHDYCLGGHGWPCDECEGYRDGHSEGCSRAPESAADVVANLTTSRPRRRMARRLVPVMSVSGGKSEAGIIGR
jgi:hypothetical protein